MPETTRSAPANVPWHFIAPDGEAVRELQAELPAFAREDSELIALYRAMVAARTFDGKAIALQRTGRLGTFPSALGQEAVAVGVCSAMRDEDVFVPSFREHAGQLLRGVTPLELLLYWGGDERGSDFAVPREDFPNCIPVATHAPHAAGVALAMQLREEPRVAVCVLGDGATSKGDFYEALNVAGAWQLPVVYVVCNNEWAISVPRNAQTAARFLSDKGAAAGVPGVRVDGNDVIAVRHAAERALERARGGDGPTLLECATYRLGDHTTADDASRYRADAEVSEHWHAEPVARLRTYLQTRALWGKQDEEHLLSECAERMDAAVAEYLGAASQPATSMFDHLYASLPPELVQQRASVETEPNRGAADG